MSNRSPAIKKRTLRFGRIALALVMSGVLYASVYFVANAQLNRLLPKAVAAAIGGRDAEMYSVTVGTVRLSPFFSGFKVENLVVSIDSTRARDVTEPAVVRTAELGLVRVSGVELIALVRGRGIFVSSVDVVGPSVALEFVPSPEEGSSIASGQKAQVSSSERVVATTPATRLGRFRIRDGSVDVTRITERGTLISFLHGLDLELTEIRIDTAAFANPARALSNSQVSLSLDTVRHEFDDSLFVITATEVRADSRDSLADIGTIQVKPTLEANRFFRRLPQRGDWIDLSAGPVRVRGLDFARYVDNDSVNVRRIDVDSLDLHVHSDINLDWGPKARPCRYHLGFSNIGFPLRVDTIQVNDALIRYSELAKGASRPGEMTLEALNGSVVNLTNEQERMTHDTPAVAKVEAKLFGESDMVATLAYPLLSPTLDFTFEASLGPMDLTVANRFATSATGIELKRGQLQSLWVGVKVQDGLADGSVHMLYRDLNFRLVDRNTLKERPWHSVAGFVGNIVVRSNNPAKPDDAPRTGTINYKCGADDMVFFEFLIHFLANGLKRIVI